MDELSNIYSIETRFLDRVYVKIHETKIVPEGTLLHIDLGSCVSVILCGIDMKGTLWIGANHLFKSRNQDKDESLHQIATLYNMLIEKNVESVRCIGIFGGGYRENSPARNVAVLNIKTVLETLSIYNLHIQLFKTGFSQAVSLYHSASRQSVIIKHRGLETNVVQHYELPVDTLFQ